MDRMSKVSREDPRPSYVQIADDIRRQIVDGDLSPGDRLPPGRTLAERYGVAPMTVQHALDELRKDDLITSSQGRAVFVTGTPKPDDLASRLDELTNQVRDLTERVADLESR